MNEKGSVSYPTQEKEINLIDLLWKLIYSWRMVMVCGILIACLLTGVKYIKDSRNLMVNQGSSIENIRNGLTEDEVLRLEWAITENKSIERQLMNNTEYQKNSILMNIDPYNENQIVLQYYIDSHYTINLNDSILQDYTQALLKSYTTYLTNGCITENFIQALNVEDNKYLAELIKTKLESDSDFDFPLENTFCVYIAGKDMEQAKAITEIVEQALEEYQSELSDKIGEHDLILVDSHEQVIQDTELADKQAKLETANYNLRLQQDSLKSKLSVQQLQVLEQERNYELSDQNNEDVLLKAGISKKYAIFGFLAGIFLACVLISLKYIMDTHIKTEKELQEFYGLRIFGGLDRAESSPKIFSFVDKWLDCLSGQKKGNLQEELELTITNLLVTCQKFEMKKVFFTTSIHLNNEEKKSADYIMGQLEKQGIEIVFEESITRNAKALVQMSEIGTVVLIEKTKQTGYQELEKELKLCQEQEAKVLGIIVFH